MEWEHEGHTIKIDEHGRFTIDGPIVDYRFGEESLSEAKSRIDREIANQTPTGSIELAMLDHQGKQVVVEGLHKDNGEFLCISESPRAFVYPDHPIIKKLIDRRKSAAAEMNITQSQLNQYVFEWGYGQPAPDANTKLVARYNSIIQQLNSLDSQQQ